MSQPRESEASPRESAALRIVERLRDCGEVAYFAGGWVRDHLLGRPSGDIDIATSAHPGRIADLFPRTVPVGVQFGVMIVVESGIPFEVATFRSDGVYVDGRRPETVSFSSPREDASRRDFTINGLFFDPLGNEVIDFVGGREDLDRGVLRSIGDPVRRFLEDKLRLLRGVRFAAVLGLRIEEGTWEAMCRMAPMVGEVSGERIRVELTKIFCSPGRVRGWELLDESGLMRAVLPEVCALKGCDQPEQFHPEGDVFVHTGLMLSLLDGEVSPELAFAVLLHDIAKPACRTVDENGRIRFNGHETHGARMAGEIMKRLRFSNETTERTTEIIRHHMAFKDAPQMRPAKLRRFMARPTFPEELELHRVDCLGSHGSLDIHGFLLRKQKEFENEPLVPPRLINGDDLVRLGLQPGPVFKSILDEVQTLQLEGHLRSRDEALDWVRRQKFPPHHPTAT